MGDDRSKVIDQGFGRSGLFADITPRQLERLLSIGKVEEHAKGEAVFREGDAGRNLYLVLQGSVRISRQVPGIGEETFAVLKTGSAFGEMALIDQAARSADAIAHETCRVFSIQACDMESLLFLDRGFACDLLWKMLRMLAERLRQSNDKLTMLSVSSRFE